MLDPAIKAQLQQLQAVIEDPESTLRFGVEPPTGLLLAGPPGTGKTTVAKVLAAQARSSFYAVSGADVMSKWVGESERNIRQVLERARANRPSRSMVWQLGIFSIGATNRPDQIDPALLRGGRLSRTIVLGLTDKMGRLAILRLHTARMPTVGVRLEEVARSTEGSSPADLRSLAQEAALAAMARSGRQGADPAQGLASVTQADFDQALERMSPTPVG